MNKHNTFLFAITFLLYLQYSNAQNVGIGTATPNTSAKLDISSTNSGVLIPRIALTNITNSTTPIAAPATGLLVFNTNAAITGGSGTGFYYWDGSIWSRVQDATSGWLLTGNAGTSATDFIGTTDNAPLKFRTNNIEQMRIRQNGNVGIGLGGTNPTIKLHVRGLSGDANSGIVRIEGPNGIADANLKIGVLDGAYSWIQSGASLPLYINNLGNDVILNELGGNVGIGTANPVNQLHILGTGNTIARIQSNSTYAENLYQVPSGTWEVGTNASGNGTGGNQFYVYDNDYRLTVQKGTGNVGIGTVAPATRLDVSSNDTYPMTLRSSDSESDIAYIVPSGTWQVGTNSSGNGTGGNQFYVYDDDYRLTVQKGTGRVGIGTTTPTNKFHVLANVNPMVLQTTNTGNANCDIWYNHPDGGWQAGVGGAGVNNKFFILEGTTGNHFAILAGGNIGMNTNAPTAKLSVNGAANKPGGGTWAVFSDARLKENVSDYKEGLSLIQQVRTVNFSYNNKLEEIWGKSDDIKGKVFQGVIAQELQKIAPDMVRELSVQDTAGVVTGSYLEVDPNKFTYALINAVKEQQAQIEDSRKQIEALKEENKQLKMLFQTENTALKASVERIEDQLKEK